MDSTQIGQAGEYLAASVLQRHVKAIAFPDIPTSYDLLVETMSNEFLRCQVKSSDVISSVNGCDYWRFHAKKASGAYTSKDCDFFAFVILQTRTIVFKTPDNLTSGVFRVRLDDATFENEAQTLQQTLGEWL
jgi:hypothetical protein